MKIRAKMRLEGIFAQSWGGAKAIFRADYDPSIEEDRRFQKATPNAMAEFSIDNETVIPALIIGKSYYFDIEEASS